MQYIKSLDGLRGIAIGLVLLFHFGYAPFGWVGVQLFFVLSGFLITSILLQERDAPVGRYLARFYWRRVLRIFPVYFAVLVLAGISYGVFGEPDSYPHDLPWLATYTANFARLRTSDLGHAFVHFWSLAVEEQFYLVWPFIVYFLPKPVLKKVIVVIIAVAPLARLATYFVFRDQPDIVGRAIYGLPLSQFDAFAMGAAIVLWDLRQLARAGTKFLEMLLLTALCGIVVLLHEHLYAAGAMKWSFGYAMYLAPVGEFVWGYSLLDAAAAIGIVCALQRVPMFRVLESGAMVELGKISYGVYIFHVPALLMLEAAIRHTGRVMPRLGIFIIYVAVTLGISALSFRYFERPFLRLKRSTAMSRRAALGIPREI
jgi:peptidoglycan/LPS O-acetylase OafA/YrhL